MPSKTIRKNYEELLKENEDLKAKVAALEASVQAFLEEQAQYKILLEERRRIPLGSTRGIANRVINESRFVLQQSRAKTADYE